MTEFESTDFREFELNYNIGLLRPILKIKLNQLELLKIIKALESKKNKSLVLKFNKLIRAVDHEENQHTNFDRTLPKKCIGGRPKFWKLLGDL